MSLLRPWLRLPRTPTFLSFTAPVLVCLILSCFEEGAGIPDTKAVVLQQEIFGDTPYPAISEHPSLAPLPDSGFAFTYLHRPSNIENIFLIESRRFSSQGEVVESWTYVTPDSAIVALAPIMAFPNGRQLSAWSIGTVYGLQDGIHARISGPGGWPEARRLETMPTTLESYLTARVLSDSLFALAYLDSEGAGIHVQRFDREGKTVSSSHLSGSSRSLYAPTLAPLPSGGLLVIWTERTSHTTSYLSAQRLDRDGNLVGGLMTWTARWMNGDWPPMRPFAKPFLDGKILVTVPDTHNWAFLFDEEGEVLEELDLHALEQNQDLFVDTDRGRILAIGEGETVLLLDGSMKVRNHRRLPFGFWPFGTALCETAAGQIVLAYEPERKGPWVSTPLELLRIEGF